MGKIIGIDLGSYNSAVSVLEGGEFKVIQNSEGGYTTPSIVAFTKDGEIKVGDTAKRQAVTNPENTIYNIKRLIGKTYEQVKDIKRPYKIVNNKGRAGVEVEYNGNKRIYSPEEISAMIIQKMKKTAEDYLGEDVNSAVITVPAYFNSDERAATKTAGEIAGLKIERIISEPTAASLNIKNATDKIYAVADIGGCTYDLSIVDAGDSVFEVLATDGDLDLGGSLIDQTIVDYLADEFMKEHNIDLRKDPMAHQRLVESAEKAKCELSTTTTTDINLPYITVIDNIPKHLNMNLSRAKFEQMINSFTEKVVKVAKSSLIKSGKNKEDISEILLVGGTTRIPYIQKKLEEFFGKPLNKSLNPDTSVSTGAAVQASVISGENNDILLLDVIPISLGIETMGGVFTKMIDANTTIPSDKTEVFSTAADNQPSVEIHVLQGERPQANGNKSLGRFHLDGIPPSPRGIPQIEVKFSVDSNSILTVTAKDKGTGKENKIRIEGSTGLSDEEIAKMKADAEANAEADKKFKEETEKVNAAESLIFSTEKFVDENSDKISDENKTKITDAITALKTAKESKDLTGIDEQSKNLNQVVGEVYQSMAQTQNESAEPGVEQTETDSSAEDVEFEEVSDEKSE